MQPTRESQAALGGANLEIVEFDSEDVLSGLRAPGEAWEHSALQTCNSSFHFLAV